MARNFALFLIAAFVFGFITACSAVAGFLLFVLGVPLLLLIFSGVAVVQFVRCARVALRSDTLNGRIVHAVVVPMLTIAAVGLCLPAVRFGALSGTWFRLFANIGHYDAMVAKARAGRLLGQTDDGVRYEIDDGPPIRMAFNPEGMLDNWSGIIFDPTGDVMKADGFDPVTGNFNAPYRITKLFGGDLVECHSLMRDYYYCSFT